MKWLGFHAVGPSSGETDRGYGATNCSPDRFFLPPDALRRILSEHSFERSGSTIPTGPVRHARELEFAGRTPPPRRSTHASTRRPSALIASRSDPSVGLRRDAHPLSTELKALATNSGLIGVPSTLPSPRALIFQSAPASDDSGAFFKRHFDKYFDTSLSRQDSRYHASSKDTLIGRATDAASRIFVTRDEFGKRRLNTSYFVGVLTAVAAHSASRPYWARSNSMPLNDFGSTVGNDAGMNLMHEFGPGLRQAVAGHMPSIVFRVEKRILRETNPRPPISSHLR